MFMRLIRLSKNMKHKVTGLQEEINKSTITVKLQTPLNNWSNDRKKISNNIDNLITPSTNWTLIYAYKNIPSINTHLNTYLNTYSSEYLKEYSFFQIYTKHLPRQIKNWAIKKKIWAIKQIPINIKEFKYILWPQCNQIMNQ